ncbi:hypothetical protein [Mucilaginibacter sp.]|uniref:hypothetical protein n=1 Tax=Mucilaginibacter sp. TaxID=1882438 RepID=UPI002622C757|nr:hypothetical protein [Mucilaginibacter sp.]MDB5032026.1 hypothetical protein [Mucilaginibacter sp.]
MKKALCMIALAAISYGTVYAAIPVQTKDTTKVKVKSKNGKTKVKKKMVKKDTTMKKDTAMKM